MKNYFVIGMGLLERLKHNRHKETEPPTIDTLIKFINNESNN